MRDPMQMIFVIPTSSASPPMRSAMFRYMVMVNIISNTVLTVTRMTNGATASTSLMRK